MRRGDTTCGSRKREYVDFIAHSRVTADAVMHDPVESVHSEMIDDVRPIAVIVAGRERGACAPVVGVSKVAAQAPNIPAVEPWTNS